MALKIDQFGLGTEVWSVGRKDGWQLKLFATHPCFMILLSLRNGLEVDRGYITAKVIPQLGYARQQTVLSDRGARDGVVQSKAFTLIPLQDAVSLKIFKSEVGKVGIQLIDFEASERAVSWRGPDARLYELAEVIRSRSWASTCNYG